MHSTCKYNTYVHVYMYLRTCMYTVHTEHNIHVHVHTHKSLQVYTYTQDTVPTVYTHTHTHKHKIPTVYTAHTWYLQCTQHKFTAPTSTCIYTICWLSPSAKFVQTCTYMYIVHTCNMYMYVVNCILIRVPRKKDEIHVHTYTCNYLVPENCEFQVKWADYTTQCSDDENIKAHALLPLEH